MTESSVIIPAKSSSELTNAPIRILHVDDEASLLKVSKQILEMQGSFQVDSVSSVEEAYAKLDEKKFDVIVSDYQMPTKNGLQFLKELKDNGNNIPFILFTGKGREEVAIEALNLGANRYFNKIGKPETIYGQLAHSILQVVEKQRSEWMLEESEENFRSLASSSPIGIFRSDLEGNNTYANEKVCEFLGMKPKDILGAGWSKALHPEDKERVYKEWMMTVNGKSNFNIEFRFVSQDKRKKTTWVSSIFSPLKDVNGNLEGFMGTLTDITERKKAEEELKESERRWVDSFNSLEDVMLIINADYIIENINDIGLKLFGKTRDEVIGKKCFQILHNLDSSIEQCPFRRTLKTRKAESVDLYDKTFDKHFNVSCSPIFNERDEIVRHIDLIKDITERKKVENALEESEEKYRSLFESAREGITITDSEGKILKMNYAAAKMLGYDSPEGLVGIPAVELYMNTEDRVALFKKIMVSGYVEQYELTLKKKDGSPIQVLISGLTRLDEEGNILQTESIFTDNTERKTREEEMKRRLMKFRLDDGNLYLVKESSPALSLEAFKDLLNVGYHGLVFSRTPEEEFIKNVDGSFEFRWLAERGGEKSLSTFEKIENNLEKSIKKSVILLDGLDYLILKNGFKETLFFVQHLREFTHLTDNVVVLSVDPTTLNAREVRLLEKEGREVEPQVFVRLPEDLLEILRFIYEHNALGSKPNYKDVREELSISKPTVGKRLKILINTGYVTENPRGRSKVLELTYKGMRLFLK